MRNPLISNINWKIYFPLFAVCIIASFIGGWLAYQFFTVSTEKASFITALATLFTAFATLALVYCTYKIVLVTKDNINGQILLQLSSEYASDDMLSAMKFLRKWHNEHGEKFVEKFLEQLDKDVNWENDRYRRRISHHFYQIYLLKESNVIDDNFLKSLVKQGKIDFLLEIIKPLDLAIATKLADKKWDDTKITFLKETFTFFEQLRDSI